MLRAIYNGDTTAPFPLPASFPFRAQWLPSTSLAYGFVVKAATNSASLITNAGASHSSGTSSAPSASYASWIVPLPAANVDELFAGTGNTVRPTVPLAGALIKRRPDGWLAEGDQL